MEERTNILMHRITKSLSAAVALALVISFIHPTDARAGARLKDISHIAGPGNVALFGYGLVVGLQGTGDGQGTDFDFVEDGGGCIDATGSDGHGEAPWG